MTSQKGDHDAIYFNLVPVKRKPLSRISCGRNGGSRYPREAEI